MTRPKTLNFLVGGALALAVGILVAAPFADRAHAAGTVPAQSIEAAIGILEFRGDKAAYTKSGKPRVRALEAVLGADISAAERDAAWKSFKAPKALPDTSAITALNSKIAALKADLSDTRYAHGKAVLELAVTKKELREALDANTRIASDAERAVNEAQANAEAVKNRYTSMLAHAQSDRARAADERRMAQTANAEAQERKRLAGSATTKGCWDALSEHVLDKDTGWFGSSVSVEKKERSALRSACQR